MGIVNRRNAVLGWAVWSLTKHMAKLKAKDALPAVDSDTRRPNRSAIVAALATAGAVAMFWRKKSGESPEE